MSLFQSLSQPDPRKTMLAYRVKHWPWQELSLAGRERTVANRLVYLPKQRLLELCNETLTRVTIDNYDWHINWAWNNIPTEEEWNKKSDKYLIRIELRISPLIPNARAAILSFGLPSERDLLAY